MNFFLQMSSQVFQLAILAALLCIILLLAWLVGYFYASEQRWQMVFSTQVNKTRGVTHTKRVARRKQTEEEYDEEDEPRWAFPKFTLPQLSPRFFRISLLVIGLTGLVGGGYVGYQRFGDRLVASSQMLAAQIEEKLVTDASVMPSTEVLETESTPVALPELEDDAETTQPAESIAPISEPEPESEPTIPTPPTTGGFSLATSMQLYDDSDHDFSLSYPFGWIITPQLVTERDSQGPQTLLTLRAQPATELNQEKPAIYLELQIDENPDQLLVKNWVTKYFTTTGLVERTQATLAGILAERLTFIKEGQRKIIHVFASERKGEQHIYTVMLIGPETVSDDHIDWIAGQKLVSSLELR